MYMVQNIPAGLSRPLNLLIISSFSSSPVSVRSLLSSLCGDSLFRLMLTDIFTPSVGLTWRIFGASGETGMGELLGKLARDLGLENRWNSFQVSSRIGSIRGVVGSAG